MDELTNAIHDQQYAKMRLRELADTLRQYRKLQREWKQKLADRKKRVEELCVARSGQNVQTNHTGR
ncbi:hypothetical protein WHK35_14475 [Staphylococcus aureus]|uniref:hypothetical protein n=1 Tax=Staphylococcus aureus TaxID=1280 RepID=UPI0039BDC84D